MNGCQNVAEVYKTFLESIAGLSAVPSTLDSSSNLCLVGGSNQYEGCGEVYSSGNWQTICNNSWDIREAAAEVICRQLDMDIPYWQYRVLPLARDQASNWKGSGPALEMSSA